MRTRAYQCLTPNRPSHSQRVMFLVGDSHAASIKNGLERSVHNTMILSWLGVTGNTCGYLHAATSGICLEVFNIMLERLTANVRSGDMVVVSHAGYKYWDSTAQAAQLQLLRNLYVSVLQPRNAYLVIVGDPPRLPTHAIYCLQNPANCYASTTNNDQNAQLAPLASEFTGVIYIEIHSLFCNSANCLPQIPGTNTFAFFDDSHLTEAGGLYLWPYFCAAFLNAGWF